MTSHGWEFIRRRGNALGSPSTSEVVMTTCLILSTIAITEEITPATAMNSASDTV